jgi:YidC/Oxa1 family membrane protein insertase
MDKNSIIGIVLIGIILIGYSFYMQPTEAELQAQKARNIAIQDSLARVEKERAEAVKAQLHQTTLQENDTLSKEMSDSLTNNKLYNSFGIFANAAKGEKEYYTIENDLIKIKISSKGGRIVAAYIKNYDTFGSVPVILIDELRSKFSFTFFVQNRNIKTEDLYFISDNKKDIKVTGEKKSLSVKAKVADNKYIEYIYSLKPNTYFLDYSIKFVGLNNDIASNIGDIPLDWQADIPKQEKSAKNENTYSNLYYKVKQEDVDYLSETSDDNEDIRTAVRWVGFKDQFFASIFIAKSQFTDAKLESKPIWEQDSTHIKSMHANIAIPFKGDKVEQSDFIFFFGPTKFSLLQDYSEKEYTGIDEYLALEKIVPLGWGIFAWVNQYAIIPIFNFLNSFISNYYSIV